MGPTREGVYNQGPWGKIMEMKNSVKNFISGLEKLKKEAIETHNGRELLAVMIKHDCRIGMSVKLCGQIQKQRNINNHNLYKTWLKSR